MQHVTQTVAPPDKAGQPWMQHPPTQYMPALPQPTPHTLQVLGTPLCTSRCRRALPRSRTPTLPPHPLISQVLGTPLHVTLPQGSASQPGLELRVGIRFATSPTSSAVQYLAPEQTAGGAHPYLFTQCQAIHARSLVPCQV